VSVPEPPTGSEPGSPAGRPGRPRVDFYVIEEASAAARLRLACRLTEKAWLSGATVLVWHTDRAELESFDELLWTFSDGSFVPHDWLTSNAREERTPVSLSADATPEVDADVVVNLASEPPTFLPRVRRLVEVLDGEEARRRAGRARFKAYRELGLEPNFHALRSS
jgi:DNA polymerase-3 subunit chi